MSVILILILFSLLLAGGFLIGFIWAVRTDQFEDQQTPAVRVLLDDTTFTKSSTIPQGLPTNSKK